jgi:hypothetical protein
MFRDKHLQLRQYALEEHVDEKNYSNSQPSARFSVRGFPSVSTTATCGIWFMY